MPRDGALTFGGLNGKLDVLRVACRKCDRSGQYRMARLIERYGRVSKWSIGNPKRANDSVSMMEMKRARPSPSSLTHRVLVRGH
jgi:hypothetical protein